MTGSQRRFTPQELGAFAAGLAVTVAASLLTSLVSPITFPLNILVSFGLGGTALYGARKLLDPRTVSEVVEQQTGAEYRQMLGEMTAIAARMEQASRSRLPPRPVAQRLAALARTSNMIVQRYEQRGRDFAGVSSTLVVLRKVDEILSRYLKLKGGELFLEEAEAAHMASEIEEHVIPMIERALGNLGRRLDQDEGLATDVASETLASLLKSLDLIEGLKREIDAEPLLKETQHDA